MSSWTRFKNMNSKGIGKIGAILVILIIVVPISYLGLIYISATSAFFNISGLSLKEIPDPIEVLFSRQLDVELYLDIEGHGLVAVPVKLIKGQIYLEDTYMGVVSATDPFNIPASGKRTAHLTFSLDLSAISLSDIQYVANAISSHNGEVKIGFEGYIEPIILFFPITVPISKNVYTLTYSNAPKVVNMIWDTTAVGVGESVGYQITVKNVFRGSTINGVIDIIVREDVKFGSDTNAKVDHFPVQLQPSESKTFRGNFVPYKESSTRGFFLKSQWGGRILAEQDNNYPPRLNIIEGSLSLVNVYWTVDDEITTSCYVGEYVKGHVTVKAINGAVDDTITIKIRKDRVALFDIDFKVVDYDVSLRKAQSREYIITFRPDDPSSVILRGYFIEIEGDLSWTMADTYPPRLTVQGVSQEKPEEEPEKPPEEHAGTPSLQNVWWTVNDQAVTEAKQGQTVKANVRIKAEGGSIQGTITVRIRKDRPLLPDEEYKVQSFFISLLKDQDKELTVTFTALEKTRLTFRGYFIQIDFDSWDKSWTMDSSYPPRLTVK